MKDLLDSIENLIFKDFEVVIIDDGSTDGSFEKVLRLKKRYSYLLRLYRQKNMGIVTTRNRLSEIANGKFISFMDSDDIYLPNRFDKCIPRFYENDCNVVIYENGLYYQDGQTGGSVHEREFEDLLLNNDPAGVYNYISSKVPGFFKQGMTIEKVFFNSIGKFDETFLSDDWALNLKIFSTLINSNYRYLYFHQPVFLYRIHNTNTYKNKERQYKLIDQIVKKMIPENKRECFDIIYAYFFFSFLFTLNWKLAVETLRDKKIKFLDTLFSYCIDKIKRIFKWKA